MIKKSWLRYYDACVDGLIMAAVYMLLLASMVVMGDSE